MRHGLSFSGGHHRDKAYVSEFEKFINHFLEEHPEVLEDQRTGRAIYWDRKVDLTAQDKAEKDMVPDDHYGFDYSAWHHPMGTKRHP